MKKNDLNQIKGSDIKELLVKSQELQKELADLVMDKNMKKLKNVKTIHKTKKSLAQILTIVRQKQLLAILEPNQVKEEKIEKKGGKK